jgi:coniferyl-aldehyde dehydrogenase
MQSVLDHQKAAQLRHGSPSLAVRKDRIRRTISMVLDHQKELLDALDQDFGGRSRDLGMFVDILGSLGPLQEAYKHVGKWMRPQRRRVTPWALTLLGARSTVRYQPKGVVGIVTSWNLPVQLVMDAVRRRGLRGRQSHHAEAVGTHAVDVRPARSVVRCVFQRG